MHARPAPPLAPRRRARTRSGGRCFAAAALAFACVLSPEAGAQAKPGDEVLSSALTREALAVLADSAPGGISEGAGPAALDAAAVLMDLAAELTPAAAEMQWLRADLAERRGDRDTLREALSAYLRERPEDDAALLKAALVRVSDAQTLDGRLERMREMIDRSARGGERTAPMRSRLSLLASEAASELGDERQALTLLASAASLDPANGPAAAAVYGRLEEAGAGPKGRGSAAVNWTLAAPVDPSPRLALARVLAGEGAHGAAAEQYDRAAVFAGGAVLPLPDVAARAAALAAAGRRPEAARLLEDVASRLDPSAPGAPDRADFVGLDLLRVALAERGAEAREMDRLIGRLDAAVESGGPAERLDARLDRAWVQAALAVRPVEEAERALEQAGGRYADADPRRELAAGWIALRRGDAEEARKAFEASGDLAMARLGLASATDAADPERVRLLRQLVSRATDPLAVVLASATLAEENQDTEPTPVGRAVLDAMARQPSSLWRMDVVQEPPVELSIEAEPARLEPFLPARLNLTVTNRARFPLAIGPDQTLRPVALANVALFEGEEAATSLPPQVFNLGRRLRLQPGESFTVPARLDHGPIGRRLAKDPGQRFRFGVSVTLDPRLAPDGAVALGPLGAVDTLRSVQAGGTAVDEDAVRGWLDAMSGDAPDAEYVALVRLAMLLGGSGGSGAEAVGPRLLNDAGELLAERSSRLGPVPLALCGLSLPDGGRRSAAVDRVLAIARASPSDLVRVSTLLGQVRDPQDPALDAAVRAGSPRLRRFAEAWTRILTERAPAPAPAPAPTR